jgi:hypothetical protein
MKKKTLQELSDRINSLAELLYSESKTNTALEKFYSELFDIGNIFSVELKAWNANNGRAKTFEKIQAARENGKKGGRPKKIKIESSAL